MSPQDVVLCVGSLCLVASLSINEVRATARRAAPKSTLLAVLPPMQPQPLTPTAAVFVAEIDAARAAEPPSRGATPQNGPAHVNLSELVKTAEVDLLAEIKTAIDANKPAIVARAEQAGVAAGTIVAAKLRQLADNNLIPALGIAGTFAKPEIDGAIDALAAKYVAKAGGLAGILVDELDSAIVNAENAIAPPAVAPANISRALPG